MVGDNDQHHDDDALLPRRKVIYCGKCGMPPEYCEYGPDFETHCDPWLKKHHRDLHEDLASKRDAAGGGGKKKAVKKEEGDDGKVKAEKPDKPWTTEQRLMAFYEKYAPDKTGDVPSLLEKYAGKEDKLFFALEKKYGPEPPDPYYGDDSSSDEGESGDEGGAVGGGGKKKNRRGASARKDPDGAATRVVVSKVAQKKKRSLTVISGMETVPKLKLKDASKAFSKRFAGSSSVKENAQKGGEKEIILQGDHMYDVAEMIVDKFGVPESCVFLDLDGDVVPLR